MGDLPVQTKSADLWHRQENILTGFHFLIGKNQTCPSSFLQVYLFLQVSLGLRRWLAGQHRWKMKGSIDRVVFTYVNLPCSGPGIRRQHGTRGGFRSLQQDGFSGLHAGLRQDLWRRDRTQCRCIRLAGACRCCGWENWEGHKVCVHQCYD